MTIPSDLTPEGPDLSPEHAERLAVADRDQARAENLELRRADAVTRLAAAAGADPERLADSRAFGDEFADLGRRASDEEITAAIKRTLTAQPSLRADAAGPARRPPGAAAGQGSSSTTTATDAQRRASQAADQSPRGRIGAELRRVADRKAGHHR